MDVATLHEYSDADLLHLIDMSPKLSPSIKIRELTGKLIAKPFPTTEILDVRDAVVSTRMAAARGVKIPFERRVILDRPNETAWVIMDRIDGVSLDTVWHDLSWQRTMMIAMKLHKSVKRLSSLVSECAGSWDTGICRSRYLQDRFELPLSASSEQIASFIDFFANFQGPRKARREVNEADSPSYLDNTVSFGKDLVFTHHNLTPKNIMLSRSGELFILNWRTAGFYPRGFEYAAMRHFEYFNGKQGRLGLLDTRPNRRWHTFCRIAAGWYDRQAHVLMRVWLRSTEYPLARQWYLSKFGGPSRHSAKFPTSDTSVSNSQETSPVRESW